MREVVVGKLWTGNARDLRDARGVLGLGVEAVVDLAAEEPPAVYPRDTLCCRFPLVDGVGNRHATLAAAIETLTVLIDSSVPTLVACSAGMSRSPLVTAAALSKSVGIALDEAIERVGADAPVDMSPGLLADIRLLLGCDSESLES